MDAPTVQHRECPGGGLTAVVGGSADRAASGIDLNEAGPGGVLVAWRVEDGGMGHVAFVRSSPNSRFRPSYWLSHALGDRQKWSGDQARSSLTCNSFLHAASRRVRLSPKLPNGSAGWGGARTPDFLLPANSTQGGGDKFATETNWRPVRDSNPCYRRERAVS